MVLELDGDDLFVLREALRVQQDTLLAELAHADSTRAARTLLKDRLGRIERLLARLEALAEKPPASIH
jgi:hypothetical protein